MPDARGNQLRQGSRCLSRVRLPQGPRHRERLRAAARPRRHGPRRPPRGGHCATVARASAATGCSGWSERWRPVVHGLPQRRRLGVGDVRQRHPGLRAAPVRGGRSPTRRERLPIGTRDGDEDPHRRRRRTITADLGEPTVLGESKVAVGGHAWVARTSTWATRTRSRSSTRSTRPATCWRRRSTTRRRTRTASTWSSSYAAGSGTSRCASTSVAPGRPAPAAPAPAPSWWPRPSRTEWRVRRGRRLPRRRPGRHPASSPGPPATGSCSPVLRSSWPGEDRPVARSMLRAMDITGASAIVTGGASGIGAATARQLAAKGAKVVVADLQEDKGKALADEIGGAFCKVDVTNTDDIIAAVEMAKEMGPLRALVNSAGIGWAQRTDRQGRQLRLGRRPRRVQEGHRDQPDRHLRLHPPRGHGDEPHRAARVRRARRDRQHRLGRRVRRPDRPGLVLRRRRAASSA